MGDLKMVYGAVSEEAALSALERFGERWGKKYPQIQKSWEANWAELSTYFKYPQEVRTLIYTTNAVEGFHRMLRKYTKTKTVYPTDDAVRKSVYLSIQEISRKWTVSIRRCPGNCVNGINIQLNGNPINTTKQGTAAKQPDAGRALYAEPTSK
jgi:putative transposase